YIAGGNQSCQFGGGENIFILNLKVIGADKVVGAKILLRIKKKKPFENYKQHSANPKPSGFSNNEIVHIAFFIRISFGKRAGKINASYIRKKGNQLGITPG